MVACAYGAERIPGKPKYVRVAIADIQRWYPTAGALFYLWMRPYVGRVYDMDALAVLNPDVPNTANWQDFLTDALRGWGVAGNTVLSTVADNQVQYWLFLENCRCIGSPTAGGCYSESGIDTTGYFHWNVHTNYRNYTRSGPYVLPSGATSATVTMGPITTGTTLRLNVSNTGGTAYNQNYDRSAGQSATWTVPIQPGTSSMLLSYWPVLDLAGPATVPWSVTFTGCPGTTPYAPASPATPVYTGMPAYTAPSGTTSDDLEVKLDALLQLVSAQLAETRWLQSAAAPYAYRLGSPSSGLTGTGYVAVSEVLGALVTLTTIPGGRGRSIGTPTRYFDIGRISWGDANGYDAVVPIHSSPQCVMGAPGTTTRIGYTFPPGVVATITPLLRS